MNKLRPFEFLGFGGDIHQEMKQTWYQVYTLHIYTILYSTSINTYSHPNIIFTLITLIIIPIVIIAIITIVKTENTCNVFLYSCTKQKYLKKIGLGFHMT